MYLEQFLRGVPASSLLTEQLQCLMAQIVKNMPAMWETWVQSPGPEDPQESGKWQPTPVFLPGESRGWSSLVGYSPQGRKEFDRTEELHLVHPSEWKH